MIDMVLCDGLLVVVEFLVELSTGGQVVMKAQPELKTNLGKSEAVDIVNFRFSIDFSQLNVNFHSICC